MPQVPREIHGSHAALPELSLEPVPLRQAGLDVLRTGIDWGPPVLKNANLKRAIARSIGKILCAIPLMQYQFIFVVSKR